MHKVNFVKQRFQRFLSNLLYFRFSNFRQRKKRPLKKCTVRITYRAMGIAQRSVGNTSTVFVLITFFARRTFSFYSTKPAMENARTIYETIMGQRCGDTHWWRVKKTMNACGLPMDKPGFELFIKLRRISPKHYAQLHKVKKILDETTPVIGDGMTGRDFLNYLQRQGIMPHHSTVSRWFAKTGGYKATAFYNKTVLVPITAMALIYKQRHLSSLGGVHE